MDNEDLINLLKTPFKVITADPMLEAMARVYYKTAKQQIEDEKAKEKPCSPAVKRRVRAILGEAEKPHAKRKAR